MNLSLADKLIIAELLLLFIQFTVGMWTNLFAIIPKAALSFTTYSDGAVVLLHIINGILIFAVAFALIWLSYKSKMSLALKLSVLTAVFVTSAVANGFIFLRIFYFPAFYNIDNYFSLGMALSFLASFTTLFAELYMTREIKRLSSADA